MNKGTLILQLVFNGRAAWQVKTEIAPEHCRRLTDEQAEKLKVSLAALLAELAGVPAEAEKISTHRYASPKKK